MSEEYDLQMDMRVDEVFINIVLPTFKSLINDYDGVGGYKVKVVSDSPLITGIEKYSSISVKHPGGQDMIVCVYWVKNSQRLIAENIQMVTLNKSYDIFSVTVQELYSGLKFLCGLRA